MRILILDSVAGPGFTHGPGEELDVPTERARELIRAGHARPAAATGPPPKGAVRTATAPAPANALSNRGNADTKK